MGYPPFREERVSGWGRVPSAVCKTYRPEKAAQFTMLPKGTSLARGNGRAYGDAALNPDGVVLSGRLDRFLAFDAKKGILKVQAGLTFADILDVILPAGWTLPVMPGTRFVSAGGAVACDVHGMNHFQQGSIGRHVRAITLQTPDGEIHECAPERNKKLLQATLGGMGMTGFIKDVTFQLKPVTSLSLQVGIKKIRNLDEMVDAFEDARATHEYTLGWINHFAKNKRLGAGYFQQANHLEEGVPLQDYKPHRPSAMPTCFPSLFLKPSVRLANAWISWRAREGEKILGFNEFFGPLDSLKNWNKFYGKKGFFQFQCLVPESSKTVEHIRTLLSSVHEQQQKSFLCVIKYFGKHEGLLSFPGAGYTVCLDFANTPKTRALYQTLSEQVCEWGGRVYLAKDAFLRPELFQKMYASVLGPWREVIHNIDPKGKMSSSMAQRLNFRGDKQK